MPWMGNRSPMTPKRIGMGRLAWLQGASRAGSVGLASLRFVNRNGRSNLQGAKKAPDSRELSARHDETSQSAWGRLPGVRLLRSDPFYARLVNTYLLANAVWVLAIHASFSNRFAYLSWFMMPWVLLYPFVPGKIIHRPRTGLIAAVLCAHYMFTYVMEVVVYPLRGMQ